MAVSLVYDYVYYDYDDVYYDDDDDDDDEPRDGIGSPILRQLHLMPVKPAEAVASIPSNCRCCSKVS